jgi:predicted ATP-grasp superfamily ATP-dependent carboligase
MTDISTHLILKYREEFPRISIPFVSFEDFEYISDKYRLCKLSQQIGVPIPRTLFVNPQDDVSRLYPDLVFPVVLKPFRSKILCGNEFISASVKYANTMPELSDIIKQYVYFKDHPFVLQEYIAGHGQGIFSLYDHGRPMAFFAHKRLREKPPSGGVSVFCESIAVDPELKLISKKILDYFKWHGIAMVEFRISHDGSPYLMEVNSRFWGSLQLTIDAGVDFPWMLYRIATGDHFDPIDDVYKIGVKSRWLLGDLDHIYLRLTRDYSNTQFNSSKCGGTLSFLNFFDKNTNFEVNRLDDMGPFLLELKRYFLR